MGAARAVRPSMRLVTGTGGGGAAGSGAACAEAAVCSDSGKAEGAATKFCTMSTHGTPGLTGAGSAAAVALSTRTGHIRPTVATTVNASRFVVRDLVFPNFVDGTATDRSFTVLLKLLKRKL